MAVYKRDIVDINLETGNIHRSFLKHSIGYKDQKADHFGIRAYRNGEPVNLTGVSIQGIFMPPQGPPIAITSGNIVNYNEAEVVLPQACYNYDGQFTLAIKLVDPSNAVTGTMRIVDGMVDNTNASGTVAPVAAIPSYQEVLSTYEQAIAAINKTVRFDAVQSLTDTQKATARGNISAPSVADLQAETTAREAADTAINNAIGTVPSGKTVQGQIDTLESGKVPKTTTVNGHALSGNVTVTKADVGLGNVDNTSDVNKPVSTAQQAAIDAEAATRAAADADLKSAFPRIKHPADNIVTELIYTQGGYYNGNGVLVSDANWGYTDLIPVEASTKYYLNTSNSQYYTLYNSGLVVIPVAQGATNFTTTSETAYVRLSVHKNRQKEILLTKGTTYENTVTKNKTEVDGKINKLTSITALDVNGKEPEYKYGYLQKSNGAISPASSGNNKYFVIYPLGKETYLFSGAYSDTTWPLVFGYDSAGNSSVLVSGGTKTNYKFTVPDGIVEIRGWSDTSRVNLKIVPVAVVKDIQEELDDLDFYVRPNLEQKIGYLGSDNGAIYSQSSGSNRYYQVKGLHGGERFIYSGGYQPGNTGWGLAFSFDSQGNATKLFAGAKTGYEFTTPNDCVELRAWGDTSNYALSLVYADAVDSRLDMLEGSSIPRMIVVDASGDGEFTDIQSAINFAKANYAVSSKPVIIYVMNGIYAISPKADSPYYAIDKGGNKISIIGESRDGVIIRCTCTDELQGIALNIGGECTIENLTIENLADESYTSETILEGNHRPYCLHNDSDGEDESKKYYTTVRNCKFYSECDTPIGAGMHTNQIQRYENVECVYAEDAVIKQQGAFYLHGPYSSGFNPIGVEIVDCVFICNNSRPAISMQNVSGTKPWAEMSQTFIRNVTYSAGSSEVSLATTSSITPQSKGNTNNTLNKQ